MTYTLVASRSGDGEGEDRSLLATGGALITSSGVPTDEQFEDIRSRFGDPRASVTPKDYFVFRMIASGDGLDSYFTRQDLHTSFPNFVRDLHKGQSVLGSHQMASFSYGSSYQGTIAPAEVDRFEYEPTFYPQWDAPDLRTSNWLIGDYFMGRDVEVNNQRTNDLIRSIELGNVRKASISFMVGSYVCGIDNRDLVPSIFGPMPDGEQCNHFPGVTYDDGKGAKQIAWALMKNNTLVETSLVYKNASPSSMLLRKAEALASDGQLNVRDIERLEVRYDTRLPRFKQTVFTAISNPATTTSNSSSSNAASVRFDAEVQEDSDMANRRRGGNDAAREFVREALTAEPEDETTEVVSEAPASADVTSTAADAADPKATADEAATDDAAEEAPAADEAADADADATADEADAATTDEASAEDADENEAERATADAEARHSGHKHSGKDKGGHLRKNFETDEESSDPGAEATVAAAESVSEEDEAETTETVTESTRVEDAVSAFAAAAEHLASTLARFPDAFDSGLLAVAARAEKGVDLALADAGCDATVGSQVYRSFEIRSKKMTETLGEPLSVEAIRTLQSKAQLGDELFAEMVKDAVAARVIAQGQGAFNSDRYRDILLGTRDVVYVKDEIASWKSAKKDVFTPGRQVTPRQPIDAKTSKEERKTLPEAPSLVGKPKSESPSVSLIQPRVKN